MSTHREFWGIPAESFAWLMVLALAVHGPMDLLITISYRHLESNPVVLAIGWPAWLMAKALGISLSALIWWELFHKRKTRAIAYTLALVLLTLGHLFILTNTLVVMGWL